MSWSYKREFDAEVIKEPKKMEFGFTDESLKELDEQYLKTDEFLKELKKGNSEQYFKSEYASKYEMFAIALGCSKEDAKKIQTYNQNEALVFFWDKDKVDLASKFTNKHSIDALIFGVNPDDALRFTEQEPLSALYFLGKDKVSESLKFTLLTQVKALQRGLSVEDALKFDSTTKLNALMLSNDINNSLKIENVSQYLCFKTSRNFDQAVQCPQKEEHKDGAFLERVIPEVVDIIYFDYTYAPRPDYSHFEI